MGGAVFGYDTIVKFWRLRTVPQRLLKLPFERLQNSFLPLFRLLLIFRAHGHRMVDLYEGACSCLGPSGGPQPLRSTDIPNASCWVNSGGPWPSRGTAPRVSAQIAT